MCVRIIERTAIVRPQDEEANHFRIVLLQHLANREEIAERLGHFFVVHAHEAVVHPVVHKGMLVCALTLRDLVFVMGKLQIRAPAMDVEMLTQQAGAHRGAFDMPARAASAPVRRPAGVGWIIHLAAFPQHEIQRVALGRVDLDPLAGSQIVERLAGQSAVAREITHRKIDISIFSPIGQAIALECADQRQHLGDEGGRPRLMIRLLHPESGGVLIHKTDEPPGQL